MAASIKGHNTVATFTQGHIDRVQSTAEAIVTVAAVDQFSENTLRLPASTALPKVNTISSVSNDSANSSPLGAWTGTSMNVAELEATAASVHSECEATAASVHSVCDATVAPDHPQCKATDITGSWQQAVMQTADSTTVTSSSAGFSCSAEGNTRVLQVGPGRVLLTILMFSAAAMTLVSTSINHGDSDMPTPTPAASKHQGSQHQVSDKQTASLKHPQVWAVLVPPTASVWAVMVLATLSVWAVGLYASNSSC
jgi:hypothetical protein